LLLYRYPFFLPNFFRQKNTKDELAVRLEVLRVFSSVEVEKIFYVQEFLQLYRGKISNQRISNMKRIFIKLVDLLKEYHLIDSRYQILVNGSFMNVLELDLDNISEGFVLFEKFSIVGVE